MKATYCVIAPKIKSHLPIGWKVDFINGQWHGCLISTTVYKLSWEEQQKKKWNEDLRLIRGLLKTMFPQNEWKITPWTSDEYLIALTIEEKVKIPEVENIEMNLYVRQMESSACELEYEEELVKKVKVKGDCGQLLEA